MSDRQNSHDTDRPLASQAFLDAARIARETAEEPDTKPSGPARTIRNAKTAKADLPTTAFPITSAENPTRLDNVVEAINHDDVAKTKALFATYGIGSDQHDINDRNDEFAFPHPLLHRAVLAKAYSVANMMISEMGADINLRDHDDNTPLHIVSMAGNQEGANFLLARGANKNLENGDHATPRETSPNWQSRIGGAARDLTLVREDGKPPLPKTR